MNQSSVQQLLDVQVRRMKRGDLVEVAAIDQESFPEPWSAEHFLALLRTPACVGIVAEANVGSGWRPRVAGFALCERRLEELALLSFAVDPSMRRMAVGQQLLNRVREMAACERRRKIAVTVGESNLAAQMFLRSMEFRAVRILRHHFTDSGEDGYRMELDL